MLCFALLFAWAHCSGQQFDVLIRGGMVYDGGGKAPFKADKISAIGDLSASTATTIVDATRLAVAPGFINMLSWASESLMKDGRSMSDIKQGVTLEVFGEGISPGPRMRTGTKARVIIRPASPGRWGPSYCPRSAAHRYYPW